ncbi:hypothetical protein GCM10010266_43160 [Streptomyces griseomycini]|nr:hypothetical protein GCM10010266_43160 [Streptomyces griseomycini]GGR25223.1 hypothetical protein GCM10015536_33800 [Streptomyces griseomycini]
MRATLSPGRVAGIRVGVHRSVLVVLAVILVGPAEDGRAEPREPPRRSSGRSSSRWRTGTPPRRGAPTGRCPDLSRTPGSKSPHDSGSGAGGGSSAVVRGAGRTRGGGRHVEAPAGAAYVPREAAGLSRFTVR